MAYVATMLTAIFAAIILVSIVLGKQQLETTKRQLYLNQKAFEDTLKAREAAYLADKVTEFYSADMSLIQARASRAREGGPITLAKASADRLNVLPSYLRLLDFFNSLFALIELGAVKEEQVVDRFGPAAAYHWWIFADLVRDLRKQRRQPDLYAGVEELAKRSLRDDDRGKPTNIFNPVTRVRQLQEESQQNTED